MRDVLDRLGEIEFDSDLLDRSAGICIYIPFLFCTFSIDFRGSTLQGLLTDSLSVFEPKVSRVFLVKTRKLDCLPSDRSILPSRLQVHMHRARMEHELELLRCGFVD